MVFQKGHPPYPGVEKGQFRKGNIPWSKSKKGIHLSPKTEFKKGHIPANFKGDGVGYFALHIWVKSKLGKPAECVYCGSEDNLEWASISHKAKRDLEDFIPLCAKCHRKYDNWSKKMLKTRYERRKLLKKSSSIT